MLLAVRGVLYVHSCPPALCPHVEWAAAAVLGVPVNLSWDAQPVEPSALRAQGSWVGPAGTAGQLASALRCWPLLRYEVTEDASPGCDGERYSHTPSLGLHRTTASANGDVLAGEDRLRALVVSTFDRDALCRELDRLLGGPWDAELEPYRMAGDGASVTRLHEAV